MWKVLSDLHSQRRSIRGRFSRDDAWLSFHEVRLGAGNSLVMNNEQHVYALRFDCDEGEDALTAVERNPVSLDNLASVNWPTVTMANPESLIEAFDLDDNVIAVATKSTNKIAEGKRGSSLWVFRQKDDPGTLESDEEIMRRLSFEVDLQSQDVEACRADCVQLAYPLCLIRLSNNNGSFEHVSSKGKPFVMFKFVDLQSAIVLRTLSIDHAWMQRMSDVLVKYDSDTSLLSSVFDKRHLVVGFGSFSAPDDGGIAIWDVDNILKCRRNSSDTMPSSHHTVNESNCDYLKEIRLSDSPSQGACDKKMVRTRTAVDQSDVKISNEESYSSDKEDVMVEENEYCQGCCEVVDSDLLDAVETLDPPTFHWEPWENHCGGVSLLHQDEFSIVAANSCVHRVASRCVEPGDHSNKDNVLVYDFWSSNRNSSDEGSRHRQDLRRPQRHHSSAQLDNEQLFQMGPAD